MNIKTLFICTGVSNIILSNMQALWGRIEKILNLFLIDLNEVHLDAILSSIDGHRVLVTIRIRLREDYTSVLCHYLKHGRDGTWYYAVLFTTCLISAYRIGLSRTLFTYIYIYVLGVIIHLFNVMVLELYSLAVSEYSGVVAVEHVMYERSHACFVELFLAYLGR